MKDSYAFYKDKLNKEYKEVFEKAELYCIANSFSEDELAEILMDLMDMFLNAQREGRKVESITGKDMERFCKNFCVKPDFRSQLWDFLKRVKRIAWLVLVFGALDLIAILGEEGESIWTLQSNLMSAIVGIGTSTVVSQLVLLLARKMMFRKRKFSMRMFYVIFGVSFVLCMIAVISIAGNGLQWNMPLWISLVICFAYLMVFYFVYFVFFKDKAAQKKDAKKNKVTFASQVIQNMPMQYVTQYKKECIRRERKGQEPISKEEFSMKYEKGIKFDQFYIKFHWIFPLVIYAFAVTYTAHENWIAGLNGVSMLGDTILFAIICGVLFIPILKWNKGSIQVTIWKRQMIKEAHNKGISFIEYMETMVVQADCIDETDTQ